MDESGLVLGGIVSAAAAPPLLENEKETGGIEEEDIAMVLLYKLSFAMHTHALKLRKT